MSAVGAGLAISVDEGGVGLRVTPPMCEGVTRRMMSEEERLRRMALRNRPKMIAWARVLGLLAEEDEWCLVTRKKRVTRC